MNAISKFFDSHVTTVLKWIRSYAKKHAPKRTFSPGSTVVLEFDEMWHYIAKKKNKLWIRKALDRNTGHLIDWECGGRNKETFEKLTRRLETLNVKAPYTDKWQVDESILPASKHVQTKAETHRIERSNCLMRHWFGRFKRKSIIVSKSVEMVNLTIALFARFRVNGDVFDILKLGGMETRNIIS
jgi:IS1 family transposase